MRRQRESLLPERPVLAAVWRAIFSHRGALAGNGREIVRELSSRVGASCGKVIVCLRVFEELGIAEVNLVGENMSIYPDSTGKKVDLNDSRILAKLKE